MPSAQNKSTISSNYFHKMQLMKWYVIQYDHIPQNDSRVNAAREVIKTTINQWRRAEKTAHDSDIEAYNCK